MVIPCFTNPVKEVDNMKNLTWIDCDRYVVFEDGRILNTHTDRYIIGSTDVWGYNQVSLYTKTSGYTKVKSFKRHRLVAEAFLPNPNNLPTVNHKDENKLNNSVENLEWASHKKNIGHSHTTGTYSGGLSKEKYYAIQKDIQDKKGWHFIRDKYQIGTAMISRMKNNMVSYEEYYGLVECND